MLRNLLLDLPTLFSAFPPFLLGINSRISPLISSAFTRASWASASPLQSFIAKAPSVTMLPNLLRFRQFEGLNVPGKTLSSLRGSISDEFLQLSKKLDSCGDEVRRAAETEHMRSTRVGG